MDEKECAHINNKYFKIILGINLKVFKNKF